MDQPGEDDREDGERGRDQDKQKDREIRPEHQLRYESARL
jgi:hypothetical protein